LTFFLFEAIFLIYSEKKEVGKEIHVISIMIKRHIFDVVSENNDRTVTWTSNEIIGFLCHNLNTDIYQKDIESFLGTTRSSVSKVLNVMEKNGYIKRQKVGGDARLRKIIPTKKALDYSLQMEEEKNTFENAMISGFSNEEKEALFEYLDRIKKNIAEYSENGGGSKISAGGV